MFHLHTKFQDSMISFFLSLFCVFKLSALTFFSVQEKNTIISFKWCGSCPESRDGNTRSGYLF